MKESSTDLKPEKGIFHRLKKLIGKGAEGINWELGASIGILSLSTSRESRGEQKKFLREFAVNLNPLNDKNHN